MRPDRSCDTTPDAHNATGPGRESRARRSDAAVLGLCRAPVDALPAGRTPATRRPRSPSRHPCCSTSRARTGRDVGDRERRPRLRHVCEAHDVARRPRHRRCRSLHRSRPPAASTSATARSRSRVAVVPPCRPACRCTTSSPPSTRYEGQTSPPRPAHADGTEELRDGDRDQNGNDQHDHHQLDEGEAFLASRRRATKERIDCTGLAPFLRIRGSRTGASYAVEICRSTRRIGTP